MSSVKPKKDDPNKARLSALKKLGLMKDVDARKSLSDSTKKKIRNEWKKYHAIANAPKSEFYIKDVAHYENFEKKQLEKSGYAIINNKLYINKEGAKAVEITRSLSKYDKSKSKQVVSIEIKRYRNGKGDRKYETEFVTTGTNKMTLRERFVQQYQDGKFKEGDYIGIKLYENGAFRRIADHNLDKIYRYAEYEFEPNDPRTDKTKLQNDMRLVKLSYDHYSERAATERSKKDINKVRRTKSINSKKTATKKLITKKRK